MKTAPHKTERLHALDSLRAIMMMLGVVLHSVLTYIGGEPYTVWKIRDPLYFNTNLELVSSCIHIFRMPVFMVVAGFFAALLFYERGPRRMFKNRMNRITYPFLVFVVLLFVPVVGGMDWTEAVFASSPDPLNVASQRFASLADLVPDRTMHLWFLYYLIMFSVASFGLGWLFKRLPWLSKGIHRLFHAVFQRPLLRLVVFTLFTIGILLLMDRTWVATSTSLVPDFNTFIFYFFFYMFGWVLFKSKSLLSSFKKYDWIFTLAGFSLFSWYFFTDLSEAELWVKISIRALCCWLFIFGITGLFIRFGSKHSATMRYVSDSSYWVYLLHLPLTIIIPGLIADWNLPGTMKFLLVTTISLGICLATYHYFVRSTIIGQFLNGRKYSRRIRDIIPVLPPDTAVVYQKSN
jgi:peptidoglycan/LPS O-acetylase OafA/YrhL